MPTCQNENGDATHIKRTEVVTMRQTTTSTPKITLDPLQGRPEEIRMAEERRLAVCRQWAAEIDRKLESESRSPEEKAKWRKVLRYVICMAVNMEPHAAWWIQYDVSEIRPAMDELALVVLGDIG